MSQESINKIDLILKISEEQKIHENNLINYCNKLIEKYLRCNFGELDTNSKFLNDLNNKKKESELQILKIDNHIKIFTELKSKLV